MHSLSFQDLQASQYEKYCKPDLAHLLALAKLDKKYDRAKGECLYYSESGIEKKVIDFLGGYGSTILGHYCDPIVRDIRESLDAQVPVHAQVSIRGYAGLLGEKLDAIIPGYYTILVNTGTEAVEASLKHSLYAWSQKNRDCQEKPVVVAFEGSFHGKTAGSLTVTSREHYRSMYREAPFEVVWLSREASESGVKELFESLAMLGGKSRIAAVIFEPIQGEGGIHELRPELISAIRKVTQEYGSALIADEIQTGLFRTGAFLACQHYRIEPDVVLLGKSLGGGMAKIAALLVKREHYCHGFGTLHSSTFAEDDLSSKVALRTLELLEARRDELHIKATLFEAKVKSKVLALVNAFPGVIRKVRGRGFMIGIDFDPKVGGRSSFAWDNWVQSGYLIYFLSSYLLHHHGVRVGATLSDSYTLRIEPSADISAESVERLIEGLTDLTQAIYEQRIFDLTAHIFGKSPNGVVSLPRSPLTHPSGKPIRKVVFLTHVLDEDHLKQIDPYFSYLTSDQRKKFLSDYGTLGNSLVVHEQDLKSKHGEWIHLEIQGIPCSAEFFENSIRTRIPDAFEKVHYSVLQAHQGGASHIGLGGFTSMVTQNGIAVSDLGISVTTGNSLTTSLALERMHAVLKERGQRIEDCHVGVVGVAGNICNVVSQMVGDSARKMTLVHREAFHLSPKFQYAVHEILKHARISMEQLYFTDDLADLVECDGIIVGTNSSKTLLFPNHIKKDAWVLDISVPSNVDPSVLIERPDVDFIRGGYACLPDGQTVETTALMTPPGQVYACLAETLAVGFANYPGHFSLGPLTKKRVNEISVLSKALGFSMGASRSGASNERVAQHAEGF